MKTRRRARRVTLETLYEYDLANHPAFEVFARRLQDHPLESAGVDFAQRLIEGVVSRRRLRELTVARLGAAPGSMDALVRVTGDARPVRSLLRPRAWLPLLVPGAGGEKGGHRHRRARRRGRTGGSNAPEAPHSIG